MSIESWLPYLSNPLAFSGFILFLAIFIYFTIIKKGRSNKNNSTIIILVFFLVLGVIFLGLSLGTKSNSVLQTTQGANSPTINTTGNVGINSQNSSTKIPNTTDSKEQTVVEQKTTGANSPAINSNGDVNINN